MTKSDLSLSSKTIPNSPTNQQTHEHNDNNNYYKPICDVLLCLTRSRSLPKGLQVHAQIVKSGIHSIPLVSHTLINFYSKTHLPLFAGQVFDETSLRSSTTWSSVIACFAQNELPNVAIDYFRRMLGEGLRADDHIYPSAAKAVAILGRVETGRCVHGLVVKSGFGSDVFVGSSVVDMYSKCGETWDARKVFDEMPDRNVVSWTGMISGHVQFGEDEEALRLFKRALSEGVEANDFTFSSAVRGCTNSTLLELGRQVHGLCFKTGFDSSAFVGTSLVSLYARCGAIEEALRVFDEVEEKNLGLWNAMLIAYAQHGKSDGAFALFERMRGLGTNPNFITFLGLLYGCSHSGSVEKGKRYFELMRNEYGIEPGAQHYASMVDLLCRAGRLDEAVKFVEEMTINPTECVWGALLTGCSTHRDAELAASVADRVSDWAKMGPGLHVLLCNAYAAAGRWEDSARVRKALRDRGMRKETGLSWVEYGNRLHCFVSGDRTHPRAHEIYAKLEELGREIENAGYVPDTRFALKRVDGEEEGERVRYHSERLAVAFALVAFPAERPIRVMKNLRVCGNCHSAIKFMSKCSKRVIILRDYNRFHRFEDANCSCGDYW